MKFDLENLNKTQKEVVLHNDGPSMVLAGAGSGKTRTLVTKISYLLEELNCSPFQILALTFSNKASREMKERVATQINLDVGALQITTFHAFCARILRSEATYLGLSRNFTIYDTSESKAIAKTLLKRRGISTKETSPFEILNFIDQIKNFGYYPGRKVEDPDYEIDTADEFYTYYLEYEEELHKGNALDFGGLITAVIKLFETFPDVLERYQQKFKYILVDEYQDTNRAQFELIRLLTLKNSNICVVGDEDQSIYSWRGADIRNILQFEEVFPEVKVLKLEQNYRSSKTIINAASSLIARNSMRNEKTMWTSNPDGDSVEIMELRSDKEEAEFIAEKIKDISKEGHHFSDIAVFYRANAQSRIIEDALRKVNLPYRVVGGVKFYDRKEIKDLVAYLRLIVNEKDSLALSRVINIPARGIGATTLRKLETEALAKGATLFEVLDLILNDYDEYSHLKLSSRVRSSLKGFADLIHECRAIGEQGEKPSLIYEKILHESGYWEQLRSSKDYESQARMENLQELESAIKQFELTTEKANMSGFLETITLDTTVDNVNASGQQGEVSLMTIHGAKGLEFEYVFVSGAEENVFPSYLSLDDGEVGIEEERRLFYVAMTRAMKKLFITFAQGRMLFGQLKFNGPSRFIQEIPDKYYVWKKDTNGYENSDFESEEDFYHTDPVYEDDDVVYEVNSMDVSRPKFPKGTVVTHGLYGEGKVTDTQGSGSDEKVTVKFRDGMKKKFMVKFAPLEALI